MIKVKKNKIAKSVETYVILKIPKIKVIKAFYFRS